MVIKPFEQFEISATEYEIKILKSGNGNGNSFGNELELCLRFFFSILGRNQNTNFKFLNQRAKIYANQNFFLLQEQLW